MQQLTISQSYFPHHLISIAIIIDYMQFQCSMFTLGLTVWESHTHKQQCIHGLTFTLQSLIIPTSSTNSPPQPIEYLCHHETRLTAISYVAFGQPVLFPRSISYVTPGQPVLFPRSISYVAFGQPVVFPRSISYVAPGQLVLFPRSISYVASGQPVLFPRSISYVASGQPVLFPRSISYVTPGQPVLFPRSIS